MRAGTLTINLVQQVETMLKRGRGVHFVLSVDNVDDFHKRISAHQANINEPKDEGWGGRFVSLQDPDGYRLFFIEYHRSE